MKIYTKTGDKGQTSLYGGKRVSKSGLRIHTYGTVDELNAQIGLLKDLLTDIELIDYLLNIQNDLFVIGGMMATPMDNQKRWESLPKINESNVVSLEREIDRIDSLLAPMTHFILPGGHPIVSHCHIARTICRRAERFSVELSEQESIDTVVVGYLNRLSDYLFVLARKLTKDLQVTEVKWIPNK